MLSRRLIPPQGLVCDQFFASPSVCFCNVLIDYVKDELVDVRGIPELLVKARRGSRYPVLGAVGEESKNTCKEP